LAWRREIAGAEGRLKGSRLGDFVNIAEGWGHPLHLGKTEAFKKKRGRARKCSNEETQELRQLRGRHAKEGEIGERIRVKEQRFLLRKLGKKIEFRLGLCRTWGGGGTLIASLVLGEKRFLKETLREKANLLKNGGGRKSSSSGGHLGFRLEEELVFICASGAWREGRKDLDDQLRCRRFGLERGFSLGKGGHSIRTLLEEGGCTKFIRNLDETQKMGS